MHALVLTEQGTELRAEGDLLVVARAGRAMRKVRVIDIQQVLIMGRCEVTSGAIALVARRGVDLVWLTQNGRFRARLATRTSANAPLRLAQYAACANPQTALGIARPIVGAKIRHQRELLLRAQRRLKDDALAQTLSRMRVLADRSATEPTLDGLRGVEGQGAALYFGQFGKLLRNEAFSFTVRSRRPPRDPVNACLSFGYAVLGSLCEQEVCRCGLDPLLGFLHLPHYGRPSLMLDLLEEFRPVVDGIVLRLINRRQLTPGDFERGPRGAEIEILSDLPKGLGGPGAFTAVDDGDDWFDDAFDADDGLNTRSEGGLDIPAMDSGTSTESTTESARDSTGTPTEELHGLTENTVGPAVWLAQTGRRILLSELFGRLRETVYYPPRGGAYEWRDVIREQVYHLARVIEGRDSAYTPFVPHLGT